MICLNDGEGCGYADQTTDQCVAEFRQNGIAFDYYDGEAYAVDTQASSVSSSNLWCQVYRYILGVVYCREWVLPERCLNLVRWIAQNTRCEMACTDHAILQPSLSHAVHDGGGHKNLGERITLYEASPVMTQILEESQFIVNSFASAL